MPPSGYNINYLSLFLFNAGIFIATLSMGQLFIKKKNPGNWLFFLLFFFASSRLIVLSLHHGGIIECPELVFQILFLGIRGGAGPVIYFLSLFYIMPNRFSVKKLLLHILSILIGTLVFFFVLSIFLYRVDERHDSLNFLAVILQVVLSLYYIMNIKMIESMYREVISLKKKFFLPLIILFIIAFLSHLASSFTGREGISGISFFSVIDSLIIMAVYFLGCHNIRYLMFFRPVSRARQKRTYLIGIDTRKSIEALNRLLSEEKLFRNRNLTLSLLAREVGLSVHQLSEIINTKLNTSFYDLINNYRIQEACNRLVSESSGTVGAIADAVGYSSVSAFYKAFKKHTGYTPIQFRLRRQP